MRTPVIRLSELVPDLTEEARMAVGEKTKADIKQHALALNKHFDGVIEELTALKNLEPAVMQFVEPIVGMAYRFSKPMRGILCGIVTFFTQTGRGGDPGERIAQWNNLVKET